MKVTRMKGADHMKNLRAIGLSLPFTAGYAALLGLDMVCLLRLLGAAMAISLDGKAVIDQYPRFLPFCILVGILALFFLIGLAFLNALIYQKQAFPRWLGVAQAAASLVLTLPMAKAWEILFDYLQKTL